MLLDRFPVLTKGFPRSFFKVLFCFFFLVLLGLWMGGASRLWADPSDYIHEPYEAPPYVPPPPPQSKVHLTNNNNGTITDQQGLMWTQEDSYAELGQCLNWYQSYDYVKKLKTGGHNDWRMPTSWEMYGIYDDTLENVMFADGAAYWYWSGDKEDTDLTDCCAPAFYFVKGFSNVRVLSTCMNGGVRAVRNVK